jgi:hypothetical protein
MGILRRVELWVVKHYESNKRTSLLCQGMVTKEKKFRVRTQHSPLLQKQHIYGIFVLGNISLLRRKREGESV